MTPKGDGVDDYGGNMIIKICDHCKKEFQAKSNRAKYCGKPCSYLGHRKNKSTEQMKKEKAEYDRQYRLKNKEMLKKKKAEWFQRTYDPEKARIERKKNIQRHVEYCRQPKYRAKKKLYDQKRLATKNYGEFWEASITLVALQKQCRSKISAYESRKERGLLNKTLERSRNGTIKRSYS